MKNIIKWLIIGLVFTLPFFFLTSSYFPFVFPKAILVETVSITVFTLWIIARITDKSTDLKIPLNKMFMGFGLYILAIVASAVNGVAPLISFWSNTERGTSVVFITCIFILSLVISAVFKNREDWQDLFKAIFVSSIIFTFLTFLADSGLKIVNGLNSTTGLTLGNSTYAGIYLSFCFFVALGLGLSSKKKYSRITYFIGALIIFLNPVLSGFLHPLFKIEAFSITGEANTALLAVVIGSVVVGFWGLYRYVGNKWKNGLMGIFIVSIISSIVIFSLPNGPVEKFITNNPSSGPTRFVFWNIAWQGFLDRPALGWGGDTYNLAYSKYFDPTVMTDGYSHELWVDKSHNIYTDELISGGVIGFVTFSLFLAIILWALAKQSMKKEESFIPVALFAAMIAFMIEGLMTFHTIYGWLILGLVAAYVATNVLERDNKINNYLADFNTKPYIFSTVAILFLIFGIKYIVSRPFKVAKVLSSLNSASDINERNTDYGIIANSYFGSSANLDSPFNLITTNMKDSLIKGVKSSTLPSILDEIDRIDIVLQNAVEEQDNLNIKLYVSGVRLMAIATVITRGQEQQSYYNRGISYVEDILKASPSSPLGPLYYDVMRDTLKGKIVF